MTMVLGLIFSILVVLLLDAAMEHRAPGRYEYSLARIEIAEHRDGTYRYPVGRMPYELSRK